MLHHHTDRRRRQVLLLLLLQGDYYHKETSRFCLSDSYGTFRFAVLYQLKIIIT